jgi:hypothetical protein
VGDVDGDGLPDLAAGAIDETTPGGGFKAGRVYLFSGRRQGLLHDVVPFDGGGPATFRAVGGQPGSVAVFAISLAGNAKFNTPYGTIALSPPILVLATVPFAGDDVVELTFGIPPAATGLVVHTQAVEVFVPAGGGAASNQRTFEVH